jgi:ABC-type spermidine/putrescine transport system permease subunit I
MPQKTIGPHLRSATMSFNEAALRSADKREWLGRVALAAPAAILLLAGLFLPICWLFVQSFIGPGGFTLEHYGIIFERPAYVGFLWTSVEVSFLTTGICTLLAYPICYAMVVLPQRFASVLMLCVVVSFFASYLVRTYSWLLLLQRRGIINSFLMNNGLVDEPLRMVYNLTGTLIGMVHILLPLMVMPLYASMKAVDRQLVSASMGLGASPARAFRDVFLPLSLPGLMSGAVLVFILSLGFYLTPAILGGGRIVTWATAVASAAQSSPVWGEAAALGVILLVLTLAALALLKMVFRVKNVLGRG